MTRAEPRRATGGSRSRIAARGAGRCADGLGEMTQPESAAPAAAAGLDETARSEEAEGQAQDGYCSCSMGLGAETTMSMDPGP